MKPLIRSYFILSVILYILVRLGHLGYYELPRLINNYLSDFLCMPIILTISLVGVRLIKRIPDFTLSPFMIFGMTTFYAVFFEFYLPRTSAIYTSDGFDVLMYYSGAFTYWLMWIKYRRLGTNG